MESDPFADERFVDRFVQRRGEEDSVNSSIDEPAIVSRVARLKPRRLLELGCATGVMTSALSRLCEELIAVDGSAAMLARAKCNGSLPNTSFFQSRFEQYSPEGTFDVVVSGMSMHLVEDFPRLACSVFSWLEPGGHFVFTQRHPLRSSNPAGEVLVDEQPGWTVSGYFHSGKRRYRWLGEEVIYYHRTLSELVTGLIDTGFQIVEVAEPVPPSVVRTLRIQQNLSSPSVLLLSAQRPLN